MRPKAPARESALAGHMDPGARGDPAAPGRGIRFTRLEPATMVLVNGARPEAVTARGGPGAPESPLAHERRLPGGTVHFLWTGPAQWLAVSPRLAPDRLRRALESALGGESACFVDLTHARTVLRIEGAPTFALLAKGCAVDLEGLGRGACVVTLVAEFQVLIHLVGDGPAVDLYVPRSLAASLWEWLAGAAAEYGYEVGEPAATA